MPLDRDAASLEDMIAACRRVRRLIEGFDRERFLSDERTQGAVIHQTLVLGEAAKRLSPSLRNAHPEVPWSLVVRARDLMIHHYDMVDSEEVWKIADTDIARLLPRLEAIAARHRKT